MPNVIEKNPVLTGIVVAIATAVIGFAFGYGGQGAKADTRIDNTEKRVTSLEAAKPGETRTLVDLQMKKLDQIEAVQRQQTDAISDVRSDVKFLVKCEQDRQQRESRSALRTGDE